MYPQSALTGGGTRDYYPNEIAREISSEEGDFVGIVRGRPRNIWWRMVMSLASALSPNRSGSGEGAAAGQAPTIIWIADPAELEADRPIVCRHGAEGRSYG